MGWGKKTAAGIGWDGTVATYANLPSATGSGKIYLVQQSSGFLWNRRAGLYRDSGTWNRVSNATFQVQDNESKFVDNSDTSKELQFELSFISTGTTRTLTAPDANGIIALKSGSPANNQIATFSDANTIQGENNLSFDGSSLYVTGSTYLNGSVTVNESGNDRDFRVESSTDANALFIDGANGNIGINAVPAEKLTVETDGGNGSADGVRVNNYNSVSRGYWYITSTDHGVFQLQDSTDTTTVRLHSSGASFLNGGSVTMTGITGSTGGADLRWNSGTGELFYDTSSKQYKENIKDSDRSEWIYKLNLKNYDRVDKKFNEDGFIAEEVHIHKNNAGIDGITYVDKDNNVIGYNKSDLVPYLTNEIQKLNKRIKELERKNA